MIKSHAKGSKTIRRISPATFLVESCQKILICNLRASEEEVKNPWKFQVYLGKNYKLPDRLENQNFPKNFNSTVLVSSGKILRKLSRNLYEIRVILWIIKLYV